MKICFIGESDSIHMLRWIEWFKKRGHIVTLISTNRASVPGTEVFYIGKENGSGPLNFIRKVLKTRKIVRQIRPDVLHAHYIFGPGVFGALSGFRPLFASVWGSDVLLDARDSRFKKLLIRFALKRADVVHVEDDLARNAVLNLVNESVQFVVAPFGVETKVFMPSARSEPLRDRFGLSGKRVVISTRNLKSIYDVFTLVEAAPLVLQRHPDCIFLIGGSGPLAGSLQARAKELGVADRVQFLGNIPHNELPGFLASSEVYVSTSISDTISVSLLEAMSCGLPVVVTDIDGNREVVREGENGLLFRPGAANELADKLNWVLADERARRRFSSLNRRIITEEYDWDECMAKVEAKYLDVVGRK